MREPTESLALMGDEWGGAAEGADGAAPDPTRVDPRPALPPPLRPRVPVRASSDRPEDLIGTVLGSYRLVELIGRGGMGFVYRAEHTRLGREVALKLLRSDYARRRGAVARFFQEARTVNRVRHRNIVDVTDFVELPDGTTFIIMELLRGPHLGRWAQGPVDVLRALDLTVQICDGLEAAHAVGVVHRDLKPDNVIVVEDGDGEHVKLLDFGVAKLLNRDDEDVGLETAAGSVIGTPAYMSPEQAGGLTVDARSDIYSLGAILYELFCGCAMFRGKSFGEYVRKHLTETPTPPRQTEGGAQLDERLEALILRCLEKDPARRHQHIGELRADILALIASMEPESIDRPRFGRAPTSRERAMTMSTMMSGATPTPAPTAPMTALTTPRRGLWIAAGIAVIACGAGITYAMAREAHPRTAAITPLGDAPATAPSAREIQVRIDARPPGDVYAAGATSMLCSTPCSITIDPADGGARDRRDFLVRRAGYLDEPVVIDLRDPAHEIDVALLRARRTPTEPAPPVDTGTATAETAPGDVAAETADDDEQDTQQAAADRDDVPAAVDRPGKSRASVRRGNRTSTRGNRTPDRRTRPAATPTPTPTATPPAASPSIVAPRRTGPVDPADTIDPFR